MCGIIAYTGSKNAVPILLEGLASLEYRGYDSAGIAVQNSAGPLEITKSAGRVEALVKAVGENPPIGNTGIGHTRWATHGLVNEGNAHPHTSCDGKIAIIHNGIVENYVGLRDELSDAGHEFSSETDSEVIAHLVEDRVEAGASLEEALRLTAGRIHGANAVVVTSTSEPGVIIGLRLGNAGGIVVGLSDSGNVMASDLLAVLPHTDRVVYLASGEMANLSPDSVRFTSVDGGQVQKEPFITDITAASADKGEFPHFMLKEIFEQPEAVSSAVRGRVNFDAGAISLPEFPFDQSEVEAIDQVILVGMGTSLHSGMLGAHFIESLARIPARADNASEFRYRAPAINENTFVIALTQSGETADTLAAMEEAEIRGTKRLAIVETDGTQATRMAHGTLLVRAGQEIGVASTKTMTNTVVTLYLLAVHLAKMRGQISAAEEQAAATELSTLPGKLSRLLENSAKYAEIAAGLSGKQHLLYLGRGGMFPAAMEGALKMKEIAYIHAEGYAAGEMKHGPIALISDAMPTIALAPAGPLQEKMVSNISEVKARGGDVIAIATEGDEVIERIADDTLFLPQADEAFSSILALIPMQLLGYHTAVALGLDPDKPRNLAKTVTVE